MGDAYAKILLRAAAAPLLNAAHPDVTTSEADVISAANAALESEDRQTMLTLAEELGVDTDLGCPLNGDSNDNGLDDYSVAVDSAGSSLRIALALFRSDFEG